MLLGAPKYIGNDIHWLPFMFPQDLDTVASFTSRC